LGGTAAPALDGHFFLAVSLRRCGCRATAAAPGGDRRDGQRAPAQRILPFS